MQGGRWLLSLKEVAAIAGVTEKEVRNEVAKQVVVPHREPRAERSALCFGLRAAYGFYVVHRSPLPLPAADRRALHCLFDSRRTENGPWRRVPNGVCRSEMLTLRLDGVFPRFYTELLAYRRGLHRVESHPQVLGGELVFSGTRISVHHVGSMAQRGVPTEEILADFPALVPADVVFARIVAAMKPGPGRPTKARLQWARRSVRAGTQPGFRTERRRVQPPGKS